MKFKYHVKFILERKGDDWLTDAILARAGFLQHVHPNLITLTGIALNFFILYTMIHKISWLTNFMLFLRYFADCLDGGVARKYKKKSKVGGALDTASDNILIYVYVCGIFYLFKIPYENEAAASLVFVNLYLMSLSGSLVDHADMKIGKNLFSNIYAFSVNNSYILYIAKILLVCIAMTSSRDIYIAQ